VSRIEYRHPDPSCNPYLAQTVMLKSGLDGIRRKADPPELFDENVYHATNLEILPENLGDAIDVFMEDQVVKAALGEYISDTLIKTKRAEQKAYLKYVGTDWATSRPRITPWELDRYLVTC
jgi:glutamine synthetase